MPQCIDCGAETQGLRCRKHHGAYMRNRALATTATDDRELLGLLAEGVTPRAIAARFGISRARTYRKIRLARGREALRQEQVEAAR